MTRAPYGSRMARLRAILAQAPGGLTARMLTARMVGVKATQIAHAEVCATNNALRRLRARGEIVAAGHRAGGRVFYVVPVRHVG